MEYYSKFVFFKHLCSNPIEGVCVCVFVCVCVGGDLV